MFINRFIGNYLLLEILSLTSYFKIKQEIRLVKKEIYFNMFTDSLFNDESFLCDKEKTLQFLKNSPFFLKEDDNYFYIKNEYENAVNPTIAEIKNFLKTFKEKFPEYKLMFLEIPSYISTEKIFFDKENNYLFPELVVYPKDTERSLCGTIN
jgi:hypothetical protein